MAAKKAMKVSHRHILYVIIVFVVAYAATAALMGTGTPAAATEDGSRLVAENFIKSAPTYGFDGDYLAFVGTTSCGPYCYSFEYNFATLHGGYGNRAGQAVTQAITVHNIKISVDSGKVISAVVDGRWDEIAQRLI
jgi:hypothetical protein